MTSGDIDQHDMVAVVRWVDDKQKAESVRLLEAS
jgi:hypothetical protein